jgi:small subunit ribosomal protein S8
VDEIEDTSKSMVLVYVDNVSEKHQKNWGSRNIFEVKKMSLNDPLANALSHMRNCESAAKRTCIVKNSSKLIKGVLDIFKKNGYITKYTEMKSSKGDYLEVELKGSINNCGATKPRFSVTIGEYEKFETRYLPAKDFGIIIVSTNQGLMTHNQAKEKNIGGRIIAYCY